MASATFKISTGLRNHLLAGGSFKNGMDGMVIKVYDDSGAIPVSPDDAVGSAVLLCVLTKNGAGTGLSFDGTPVAGVLSKDSAEEWFGEILASGRGAFFRGVAITDTGAASATAKRIQGTVGLVNADFLVRDINFVLGEEQRADSCNIGMPENA